MAGVPRPALAGDAPLQVVEVDDRSGEVRESTQGRTVSATSRPQGLRYAPTITLGQGYGGEVEPNGTPGTATPLASTNAVVRAGIFPAADVDFFRFSASAGDRVYAATMTSFSASSFNSQLTLLGSDGTTVIEFDEDNGTFGGTSSTIAGATIPTTGTYYLRVADFTAAGTERPYELHVRVQSGAPRAETEPNDGPAAANPLPASGWVSGARNPGAGTETDWYSLTLNAGDTVFLSMDLDPERDGTTWNGRMGIGLLGDANNLILVVDDAGAAETPTTIPSEATFMTVKNAGTYYAYVDSATATTGGPTATYHLSVSVHPAVDEGVSCTTYTSTDVPKTIGPDVGLVSSTLTVPGNPRIADVDVNVTLNHAVMQELDVHLRTPAGNDNGLFTDIGSGAVGGQAQMDITFDDEAGLVPAYTVLRPTQFKPEVTYRLGWLDGENAGGTWTLDLYDDTTGLNGGTLTAWSLRICEPPPPPSCPAGSVPTTVFSTDFESGASGFTHTGTLDEWELGLPATLATTGGPAVAPFSTCNSGTSCWKTDLDNTYELNSSQDLLSPNINLANLFPPVVVSWAQRYQMESASFDHLFVDHRQVGGTPAVRLFEWQDTTMSDGPGNPIVNLGASSGWSTLSRRADSLAGLNTELRFHLDSDNIVNLAGLAIDDVSVTACSPTGTADLAITKTDGVASAVPGGTVTYTITASNAGADPVPTATVSDTFPASLTCTWTCTGAGGGTCSASGSGPISDPVNLPAGGSATYTATCTISAAATGTLTNTATVSGVVTDPNTANNTATDTDTLTPQADLSITKTDGQATTTAGAPITYTIVASNPGLSNVTGATVADTVPATITGATWTCTGAGGGTCTASGSGNINDTVNLPAGGSVTYTLMGTVSPAATGTISNTATVAAPGGVTDPNPANNSATDTDAVIGLLYFTLQPCRVIDTRGPAGPLGGPALQGQQTRTFTMVGTCGIPATAKALVVVQTVTQQTSTGHVTLFPGGTALPNSSSINFVIGRTRANNGIVGLSPSGELAAFDGQDAGNTVQLIVDVFGYFQ